MKRYSKLIVSIIIASILIVATCIIIIINKNEQKNNINEETAAIKEDIEVKKVENINITYNIEQTVNNIIEKLHDAVIDESDPEIKSLAKTMPELITNELKLFNIEKAYEANYNDLAVYFTEGYLMYNDITEAPEGDINKQTVKIILYRNKENNNYTIEQYGTQNNYLFKFDYDDIDKISIRKDILDNELFYLVEKIIFAEKYELENKVDQAEIISWYYNDYRNKVLFKNQNREEYKNAGILKIEEKSDNEYTITINDERKVKIKPGNVGKEYSIL